MGCAHPAKFLGAVSLALGKYALVMRNDDLYAFYFQVLFIVGSWGVSRVCSALWVTRHVLLKFYM